MHGLNAPASEIGPALRIKVESCRTRVTLRDGTEVRRGDRIGVLHLNNDRLATLHCNGAPPVAVGLAFRRQLFDSLDALADAAAPGERLADVRAFLAVTILHERLERLGFEPDRDGFPWSALIGTYQRALLSSLHPAGSRRLTPSTYAHARRVWLSRDVLLARWGQAAKGRSRSAGRAVDRAPRRRLSTPPAR